MGEARPAWARWLLIPLVAVVVGVGVWVTGGLVTDDEQVAKALTALWFGVAGLLAMAVAWRHRPVALPILVGYGLSAAMLGGFLMYSSTVDRVVDEDVVVADDSDAVPDPGASPSADTEDGETEPQQNMLLSRGSFTDGEHPTDGVASVIATPQRHVLTLTMFATDPGPDLRVYLVPDGTSAGEGVDLGGLKGNKGDQQYEIPSAVSQRDLQDASVVIWCRAFSVAFGTAELKT